MGGQRGVWRLPAAALEGHPRRHEGASPRIARGLGGGSETPVELRVEGQPGGERAPCAWLRDRLGGSRRD